MVPRLTFSLLILTLIFLLSLATQQDRIEYCPIVVPSVIFIGVVHLAISLQVHRLSSSWHSVFLKGTSSSYKENKITAF